MSKGSPSAGKVPSANSATSPSSKLGVDKFRTVENVWRKYENRALISCCAGSVNWSPNPSLKVSLELRSTPERNAPGAAPLRNAPGAARRPQFWGRELRIVNSVYSAHAKLSPTDHPSLTRRGRRFSAGGGQRRRRNLSTPEGATRKTRNVELFPRNWGKSLLFGKSVSNGLL